MEVKMVFDYKKEYKEFYMPKNIPSIVNIPKMNYLAVRGVEIQILRMENIRSLLDCYMQLLLH